ncbi:hypothetical protein [Tautonia rosea]|uniref:hypothetical protein n=1 Tax=Tautonia rosea TaxID=2728037 RepID=UPI0014732744|nr:hypothetical protein [Tautonia rosea]
MEPITSDSAPLGGSSPSCANEQTSGGADPSTGPPSPWIWAWVVVAGLVAALMGWGAGELALVGFKPGFQMDDSLRQSLETATAETRRQMNEATTRSATVAYGVLAAALGLCLGVAGGMAGRSRSQTVSAVALATVLGGLAGAASTYALTELFHEIFRASSANYSKDMLTPLLLHGGMWLPAGFFGGLALGLASGGWRRAGQAVFGGCLGVVCGVVVFEILAALLFPTAKTTHPLASSALPRLFAHLSVALLVALLATWSIRHMQLTRAPRSQRS